MQNYQPDPFGEEKPNILELTPLSGSPNLLHPAFKPASEDFSAIELTPLTLLSPIPADGIELKKRKRDILNVGELTRKGLMEIVSSRTGDDHRNLQIGFMAHSPTLKKALEDGELNGVLKALSESYREVYGNDPWNEYLCCSNPGCSQTRSIGEVFGPRADFIDLTSLESDGVVDPADYRCPKDGAEMQYFYDPEKHLSDLGNGFNQQVFATLLFEGDHRLMGFCLGWETTVEGGWQDKIIPGKGDASLPKLSYEEYMAEALRLFGMGTEPSDKVLNVAEWGINKNIQGKGTALMMMRALYANARKRMQDGSDEDFGVFAHSLDQSRAFKITSKIGFQWGKTLPSGERRAYLKLQKAIEGIDRMLGKPRMTITPVEQTESPEQHIPRDTLVIEMLCDEAVGSDENGNKKVHQYLAELASMMGLKSIGPSMTHLSPKYGLSGWLPLENGSAIHLYAWDYEDGSHPPFLSIDISTPGVMNQPEGVIQHAEQFFKASSPSVKKKMQEPENNQWQEIAPQILRQRISISGKPQHPLSAEQIKEYLKKLAPKLDMLQLSDPIIVENSGWMHWETSGVVLNWDEQRFNIDIYTCKAFEPKDALEFTNTELGLENVRHKNF